MADELGAFNFFRGFEPTSMMKSGETWVKGTQDIFMTFAETAKTQMQEATESLKAGMSAKTLAELGDIQSKLAKDAWHNSSTNAAWLVDEFKALAERTMATAKGSGAP